MFLCVPCQFSLLFSLKAIRSDGIVSPKAPPKSIGISEHGTIFFNRKMASSRARFTICLKPNKSINIILLLVCCKARLVIYPFKSEMQQPARNESTAAIMVTFVLIVSNHLLRINMIYKTCRIIHAVTHHPPPGLFTLLISSTEKCLHILFAAIIPVQA